MGKNAALVLAAGKGTRMHSDKPKVLQKLLGEPMLKYVYHALMPAFNDDIFMLIGYKADFVKKAFSNVKTIMQESQLGTAHALLTAIPVLIENNYEKVLLVNGDVPLLSSEMVERFIEKAGNSDLAFATILVSDAGAYGRVVRKNGKIEGIIEAKDYSVEKYGPESGEINVGMYLISLDLAKKLLPKIQNNNAANEYYVTDLIGLSLSEGYNVIGIELGRDESLLGVNSPIELANMEEILRKKTVENFVKSGVLMHSLNNIRISPFVNIEKGVEITGPCEILGKTSIKKGSSIAPFCFIKNCEIGENVEIRSFCHLDSSIVKNSAIVGPYARLRPGSVMEENSHIGNFVEMKKAVLGKGAKANHLTYLGDANIGAATNIGAGTITCNYDGKNKYKTVIGKNAFIGSNTALVAPVKIGDDTLIGAGSVVTKDVPNNNTAIARSKQKNIAYNILKTCQE